MTDANLQLDGERVTLRFDRVIPASPTATWSALVDPSMLKEWLAEAEFDASVGGAVHLVWPGQGEMRGTVQVCEVPSLIEYTWDEATDRRWCALKYPHAATTSRRCGSFIPG